MSPLFFTHTAYATYIDVDSVTGLRYTKSIPVASTVDAITTAYAKFWRCVITHVDGTRAPLESLPYAIPRWVLSLCYSLHLFN